MTGHRLPHTKRGLCHVCRRRAAKPGQAKCSACHAEYMRGWRLRQRDELERLRALERSLLPQPLSPNLR